MMGLHQLSPSRSFLVAYGTDDDPVERDSLGTAIGCLVHAGRLSNLRGNCQFKMNDPLRCYISETLTEPLEERVQLKVRVGLRCLVEDLAPVIVPTSVSPKNAQGQHLLEVFHLPPRPRNLEPALHHVTMGALDGARTDGQTCRPSTLVIQVIRMVDEIAVAG